MPTRHLAIALAAALAVAPAAVAQEFNEVDQELRVVDRSDLDLSLPSAGAELHARIIESAQDACRRRGQRTVQELSDRRMCIRAAIQSAVNRVDEPTLTRAHLNSYDWAQPPGTEEARRLAMRP